MGSYLARYKRYIVGTFIMNVLAALFNVFSFSILLPILQILFKVNEEHSSSSLGGQAAWAHLWMWPRTMAITILRN